MLGSARIHFISFTSPLFLVLFDFVITEQGYLKLFELKYDTANDVCQPQFLESACLHVTLNPERKGLLPKVKFSFNTNKAVT